MFAFDKALIIQDPGGRISVFFVLDAIDAHHCAVIPRDEAGDWLALTQPVSDEAIDLLVRAVRVVRFPEGKVLEEPEAAELLSASQQYPLVLAGHRLQGVLPRLAPTTIEDLTLAFDLEVAKRRMSATTPQQD